MKLSFLAWLCLLFIPMSARADMWSDSKPPLSWQQMLDCELVVVAHYQSHQTLNPPKDDRTSTDKEPNAKMQLRIDRVLKGSVKPGATIEVFLEHLYSIQTGATGWDFSREDKKDDGIPKLCYQQQLINPGGLVPIPISPDARQPILYFLPKAARPTLTQRGQIQPLLWEGEWHKALENKPTDTVFRLMQNVSTPVRREALEELYARRDSVSLNRLFQLTNHKRNFRMLGDWRWWDFNAHEVLSAIGDRKGDVYNRAQKANLFGIMARVDPKRAWREITRFLNTAISEGRAADLSTQSALYSLQNFQGDEILARKAFDHALSVLGNPRLDEAASEVINRLLAPQSDWYYRRMWLPATPHFSPAQLESFRVWAKPRLLAALAQSDVLPEPKKRLEYQTRSLWPQLAPTPPLPQVDLARAEKVLLDPTQKVYAHYAEGEAYKLLRDIKQLNDPKFIPLLVRVLREVPAARSALNYSFGETMLGYARDFPEAMRREFIARDMENFFADEDSMPSSYGNLPESVGLVSTIYQLRDAFEHPQYRALLLKYPPSQKLVEKLESIIARGIGDVYGPNTSDLEILFSLAPDKATPLLQQALAAREKYSISQQRALLLMAIEKGRRDLMPQLIEVTRAVSQGTPQQEAVPAAVELLRLSNEARDYKRYLEWLDYTPPIYKSPFASWRSADEFEPNSFHVQLLVGLASKHRAEYSRRVWKLLQSPSLPQRQTGEQALKAVFPDAVFSAEEFTDRRAVMLQKLRPILTR